MSPKIFKATILAASMLLAATCSPNPAQAQEAQSQNSKAPYPAMASLDQYLIADRNAEIALAKSAAPPALSNDATILVLEKDGYHTAIEGKNGFTCVVERGWMSPLDSPDFWNPRLRGPICYNPAAVRSILPYTILRTKLILSGLSKEHMADKIQTGVASSQLPQPEPGAMSYMLSKDQYLGDEGGHWHPHLMFHLPRTGAASWGANLPGSPVLLDTDHHEGPEPESIFMVPVDHWSDGTSVMSGDSATHQH
jgi:hypothetical protein